MLLAEITVRCDRTALASVLHSGGKAMRFESLLLAATVAVGLAMPMAQGADDKTKAKGKPNKVSQSEGNNQGKKSSDKEWKRSTEGHRPDDLNGDGIISRNEWPGNDASFRELDTDKDGVLTNKDRGYGAQGGEKRMYERPVNDYPTRKGK